MQIQKRVQLRGFGVEVPPRLILGQRPHVLSAWERVSQFVDGLGMSPLSSPVYRVFRKSPRTRMLWRMRRISTIPCEVRQRSSPRNELNYQTIQRGHGVCSVRGLLRRIMASTGGLDSWSNRAMSERGVDNRRLLAEIVRVREVCRYRWRVKSASRDY